MLFQTKNKFSRLLPALQPVRFLRTSFQSYLVRLFLRDRLLDRYKSRRTCFVRSCKDSRQSEYDFAGSKQHFQLAFDVSRVLCSKVDTSDVNAQMSQSLKPSLGCYNLSTLDCRSKTKTVAMLHMLNNNRQTSHRNAHRDCGVTKYKLKWQLF